MLKSFLHSHIFISACLFFSLGSLSGQEEAEADATGGDAAPASGGDAAAAARTVLETGEFDYAWNLQIDPAILRDMEAAGKGTVTSSFGTAVERLMVNLSNPDAALEIASEMAAVAANNENFSQDEALAMQTAIASQVASAAPEAAAEVAGAIVDAMVGVEGNASGADIAEAAAAMTANVAAADPPVKPVPTTITSIKRLFAGLTRSILFLCVVHLSANGPSGIFESKAILV